MTQLARPAQPRTQQPRSGSVRGLLLLAAVLVAVCLLSLAVGSRGIAPGRVLDLLLHPDGSAESTIVHQLRIPRTLVGLVAGICLGVSGALMQGHTRNPLADPGLLGVTAGASFAVVVGIFVLHISAPLSYAWFALAGAGIAALVVFMIGSTKGGPDPVTLVLAGTAVSAVLAAMIQTILLRDDRTLEEFRFWIVGSVSGRDLGVVTQLLPFMVLGLILAWGGATGINMLQLGDDVATSLGMNPTRHKVIGIFAVMLLAGTATAACGPIAFVGLVVPHIARHIAGVDYRWIVPYAGLLGGLLVIVADIIGRIIASPAEMQVGIVMALLGGPVFVILARRLRLVRL